MKRFLGFLLIFVLLAAGGGLAQAQQKDKVFRIGFLAPSNASGSAAVVDVFRQELRKLGWVEGKNISIEYRFAEGRSERLSELAAELARLKVDLIVTTGDGPTLAAKKATTIIPIVMTTSSDPVAQGFVRQSCAAWRECHRTFVFSGRPKYQKAGDT